MIFNLKFKSKINPKYYVTNMNQQFFCRPKIRNRNSCIKEYLDVNRVAQSTPYIQIKETGINVYKQFIRRYVLFYHIENYRSCVSNLKLDKRLLRLFLLEVKSASFVFSYIFSKKVIIFFYYEYSTFVSKFNSSE